MQIKRIIIAFIIQLAFMPLLAQELTIKGMQATNDLSASQFRRTDRNGEPCGLVKVSLAVPGVTFEGNVIQPVEYKGGEYWVYMTKGSKELRIKHLAESPSFVPCHVSFIDYGIKGLESLVSYELTLLIGEKLQKLIIDYVPKDAMVLIDSKPYQENGHIELSLPLGSHDYVIAKKGYTTIDGVAKLYEGNPRRIVETLQPEKNIESDQVPKKQKDVSPSNNQEKKQTATPMRNQPDQQIISQKNENPNQRTHIVKNRDTIFGISRLYGISTGELIKANPEMNNKDFKLKKGTILNIPFSQTPNIDDAQRTGIEDNIIETFTVKGVSFNMVRVEGGTFLMGANDSEAYDSDKPMHQVTLSDYSIGETEVTQELWATVMDKNPSGFKGANLPVEKVSWNDCQEFINKLNALTGRHFRLPTEAEWEYAARGGSKSRGYKYSGSNNINDVAWYKDNSNNKTHPVKTKQANELGLYDMSGNVFERCQDWYGEYTKDSQTNPKGASSSFYRIYRGGSWEYHAKNSRVSARNFNSPERASSVVGLRLAM